MKIEILKNEGPLAVTVTANDDNNNAPNEATDLLNHVLGKLADQKAQLMSADRAKELKEKLPYMLHSYSPSERYTDYECKFCDERSKTNNGDINHAEGCFGIRLQTFLNESE